MVSEFQEKICTGTFYSYITQVNNSQNLFLKSHINAAISLAALLIFCSV